MKPTTIYIANLSHVDDEGHPATDSIPINIGYLGAYVREKLGPAVHVELFNLPSKLEDAFGRKIPHILACSNYVWSSNLNYHYISHYKELHPEMVTVMGGPNYPGIKEKQIEFLKGHDAVDFYVYEEGEITFLELVRSLAENDFDAKALKAGVINGCHYMADNDLVDGGPGERLQDLNTLPSPYTTGLFDEMLKDNFVPMIQTDRGCPFSCAYCHSSMKYYNRLHKFSLSRVSEEVDYIGRIATTKTMHLTNDNFGILDQDLEIAKKLAESRDKQDWPLQINLCTAKSRKDNVLKCLSSLGNTVLFTASMQSMNEDTLKTIKRKNLPFSQQKEILAELRQNNVRGLCELILGMPEETKESHLKAIEAALDAGIEILGLYTCMLLKNTVLAEDPEFDRYNMVKKHRVIPRDFGTYLNRSVIETEEVCVATRDLTFEDYVSLRGFHFTIATFYNLGAIDEIVNYLRNSDISVFSWLSKIHETLRDDDGQSGETYRSFIDETRSELRDSEAELLEYYSDPENYQNLIDGKQGANLLQKYSAVYLDNLRPFVELAVEVTLKNYKQVNAQALKNLSMFCLDKRADIFNQSLVDSKSSYDFDVLKWIADGMQTNIENFADRTELRFFLDVRQKEILENYLKFYGGKQDMRGKIVSRIQPSLLYRNCSY